MNPSFTDKGIRIGDNFMPLYSGTFHYWRVKRQLWPDILRKISEMGFSIIETYMPWSVHEIKKGSYDFGEIDPNKDIDAFLSLCEEEGLKVIARPGPHINAEMSLFGYPDRIIYDPDIQARSPWGTPVMFTVVLKPFPIPSYASGRLFEEAAEYFSALAPILKRHAGPHGAVCALQIDNETSYFFKDQAYAMDYSADAVAQYRRMLAAKYGSVEALNKVYRTKHRGFTEIDPPSCYSGKRPEDLPYYLDWAEYKEYQILEALRRISAIWRALGIELPTFQNIWSQNYSPIDLPAMESEGCVDVAGIDLYPEPGTYRLIRDRTKYLVGTSRFPFIPEFGCGSWYERRKTLTADEEEFITLYAFMNGARGINYYMLVERDRWQGSPITVDGRVRKAYFDLFKSINSFLRRQRFWNFKRSPRVLLLKNYDKGRFDSIYTRYRFGGLSCNEAFSIPDAPWELFAPNDPPPFPCLGQSSYSRNDSVEYVENHWGKENIIQEVAERLSAMCVEYDISDTHLAVDRMAAYDLIICCTYDFIDAREADKLISCAKLGCSVMVGPTMPRLDRNMFPILASSTKSNGTARIWR